MIHLVILLALLNYIIIQIHSNKIPINIMSTYQNVPNLSLFINYKYNQTEPG